MRSLFRIVSKGSLSYLCVKQISIISVRHSPLCYSNLLGVNWLTHSAETLVCVRQGCSCSAIEIATVLTVENSMNFYVKPIVGYSSRVEISNINRAFGDRRVTWAPILLYLHPVGLLSCRVTLTSTMRFLFSFLVIILNILFHFTFASPVFY